MQALAGMHSTTTIQRTHSCPSTRPCLHQLTTSHQQPLLTGPPAQPPAYIPAQCSRASHMCRASSARASEAVSALKKLKPQAKESTTNSIDPAYTNGAAFLKNIGFTNPAEIARVLDVAMNPHSLFIDYGGKRSRNASARTLSVEEDMQPVVDFLVSKGVQSGDILKIISGHPPVLSYNVKGRLEPFWDYMTSLGVQDVAAAVISRPTLLGLDVDANLKKIVGYLQYVETPPDQIIKYLLTSI